MIQRIQSIYLLITAILMAVTVCSPLAWLQGENGMYVFRCLGIYDEPFTPIYWTWGVISIAVLSAILAFINIFLFKKRKVQITICNIISLLIVILYITTGTYIYTAKEVLGAEFERIDYGVILPTIALVLNILAIMRIKKDEKLVQSLNRIR